MVSSEIASAKTSINSKIESFLDLLQYMQANFHFFVIMWVTFIIFAGLYFFAFSINGDVRVKNIRGFIAYCFPAEIWLSKSTFIDLALYITSKFTKVFVTVGQIYMITLMANGVSGGLHQLFGTGLTMEKSVLTMIVFGIFSCGAWDFSYFASHYLQHRVPFMWEIHKVHHSATNLNVLTSKRLHPLADKLDITIASVITGVAFGIGNFFLALNFTEMFSLLCGVNIIMTVAVLDALRHSHIPVSFGRFEAVFVSPRMHHLHHSVERRHWDKNMGFVFSVWDRLFGTFVKPQPGEVYTYGIGRGEEMDRQYTTLYGAYVFPVVKMFQSITGADGLGHGIIFTSDLLRAPDWTFSAAGTDAPPVPPSVGLDKVEVGSSRAAL